MSHLKTLSQVAKQLKARHVQDLLAASQRHLEVVVPMHPIQINEAIEGYNQEVGELINRYGKHLKEEAVRIYQTVPTEQLEAIRPLFLQCIADNLSHDLYEKRFQLLLKAIERKLQGFGVVVDWNRYRINLPQSLARVHATNRCRAIQREIESELDIVKLAALREVANAPGPEPEAEESVSVYSHANNFYNQHQGAFFVVGIVLSILLALAFAG